MSGICVSQRVRVASSIIIWAVVVTGGGRRVAGGVGAVSDVGDGRRRRVGARDVDDDRVRLTILQAVIDDQSDFILSSRVRSEAWST